MAVTGLVTDIQVTRGDFRLDAKTSLPASGVSIVFGPSGSGKTTFLRAIAGLEKSRGTIEFNGSNWQNDATGQPVKPTSQRPLAYVFQEASLFPHMSVRQNLAFAERHSLRPSESSPRQALIRLFDIEHTLERRPHTLSGGERQRVAIARALLRQPDLLLMDEPLAALDEQRKQEILPYLEQLKTEFNVPIIYVTHSLQEATRLGDYIIAIEKGQIVSQGAIYDVLSDPLFPGDIGREAGSVIRGKVTSINQQWHLASVLAGGAIASTGGFNTLKIPAADLQSGDPVRLWVQARDISLSHSEAPDSSISNSLQCIVTDISYDPNPALMIVRLSIGAHTQQDTLITRITRQSGDQLALRTGTPIFAHIKTAALI